MMLEASWSAHLLLGCTQSVALDAFCCGPCCWLETKRHVGRGQAHTCAQHEAEGPRDAWCGASHVSCFRLKIVVMQGHPNSLGHSNTSNEEEPGQDRSKVRNGVGQIGAEMDLAHRRWYSGR